MSLGIVDYSTFLIGTIFIILLPGPNSLYVMTTASRHGARAGARAALGVLVGDTVLMFAAVFGAASLLKLVPTLFLGLRLAGAVYLCWIGLQLMRAAWRASQALRRGEAIATPEEEVRTGALHPFRSALLISLMNPKAILFFFSFFIQFVDPQAEYPLLAFLVLGVSVQLCSMTYLATLVLAGAKLAAAFRRRRRLAIGGTGAVGALFVAFGMKLATASLD